LAGFPAHGGIVIKPFGARSVGMSDTAGRRSALFALAALDASPDCARRWVKLDRRPPGKS
jgi:hypothetical protein